MPNRGGDVIEYRTEKRVLDYAPAVGFAARGGFEARGRKELEDDAPWPTVDPRCREGTHRGRGWYVEPLASMYSHKSEEACLGDH